MCIHGGSGGNEMEQIDTMWAEPGHMKQLGGTTEMSVGLGT